MVNQFGEERQQEIGQGDAQAEEGEQDECERGRLTQRESHGRAKKRSAARCGDQSRQRTRKK